MAATFSFLFPCNLKDLQPSDIELSVRELISLNHLNFSEDLISEVRSFATDFKEEIGEAESISDLLQFCSMIINQYHHSHNFKSS